MGCLTCAKIESIEIDPDEGGVTRMVNAIITTMKIITFLTFPFSVAVFKC